MCVAGMDSCIHSMHNVLKTSGQQKKPSLQLLLEVLHCYVSPACIVGVQLRETSPHPRMPRLRNIRTSKDADNLNDAALIEAICYVPKSGSSMTASAVTSTSAKDVQL